MRNTRKMLIFWCNDDVVNLWNRRHKLISRQSCVLNGNAILFVNFKQRVKQAKGRETEDHFKRGSYMTFSSQFSFIFFQLINFLFE